MIVLQSQFDIRFGKSTVDATIRPIYIASEGLEYGFNSLAFFIDLCNSFDSDSLDIFLLEASQVQL